MTWSAVAVATACALVALGAGAGAWGAALAALVAGWVVAPLSPLLKRDAVHEED